MKAASRGFTLSKRVQRLSTSTKAAEKTHEVFNQSRPFVDVDLWKSDAPLRRGILGTSIDADDADALMALERHGRSSGYLGVMSAADQAEANKPQLDNFDQYGRRIDSIRYHPSYHRLMQHGIRGGTTSYGYIQDSPEKQLNGHIVRAGLMIMQNQIEPGHCCPLVMTSACIPVLQAAVEASPNLDKNDSSNPKMWLHKALAQNYDFNNVPIEKKDGITMGMSMTEKQGGSDVKANTTTAIPEVHAAQGEGQAYRLWGHKWFTSAPMSDGFLTLAKVTPNGKENMTAEDIHNIRPTCFLVPRYMPDGERNEGFHIMRLKNKLADRSNASSEVEYHGAYGQMIGGEGKGLQTILQMVQMTRLDCTLGSAGGARRALSLALNHVNGRSAFGMPLLQQPLMENVLTDLCITSEATTLSAIRMASAHARSTCGYAAGLSKEEVQHETDVFRVGVAILKYYCTKAQPQFTYECMEIFGGNGFTEDFPIAKLFRHSPLNSIWEGSGNVMALDVLRASSAIPAFLKDMQTGVYGKDRYLDAYFDDLNKIIINMNEFTKEQQQAGIGQRMARFIVDRLAIGYQASLLLKYGHADGHAAGAFIESRIRPAVNISVENADGLNMGGSFGVNYGSTVFEPRTARAIIEDNMPQFSQEQPEKADWPLFL
jgi:putative acyl-CoA dehydrogenase